MFFTKLYWKSFLIQFLVLYVPVITIAYWDIFYKLVFSLYIKIIFVVYIHIKYLNKLIKKYYAMYFYHIFILFEIYTCICLFVFHLLNYALIHLIMNWILILYNHYKKAGIVCWMWSKVLYLSSWKINYLIFPKNRYSNYHENIFVKIYLRFVTPRVDLHQHFHLCASVRRKFYNFAPTAELLCCSSMHIDITKYYLVFGNDIKWFFHEWFIFSATI